MKNKLVSLLFAAMLATTARASVSALSEDPAATLLRTERLEPQLRAAAKTNKLFKYSLDEGMLGVRFGMPVAKVIRILGKPYDQLGSRVLNYSLLGFSVLLNKDGTKVFGFACGSGCDPEGLLAKAFKGVTREGIAIGATEAQIRAAYGEPTARKDYGKSFVALQYFIGNKKRTVFLLLHNHLRNIQLVQAVD